MPNAYDQTISPSEGTGTLPKAPRERSRVRPGHMDLPFLLLTLMLLGHWIINNITSFMEQLWGNFALYIK